MKDMQKSIIYKKFKVAECSICFDTELVMNKKKLKDDKIEEYKKV